jgi:hypothetical protein
MGLFGPLIFSAAGGLAAAAGTPEPVGPSPVHPPWHIQEGEPFRTVGVEVNPLGILFGRYSATIEYMLAPHHAVTLSPYLLAPSMQRTRTGWGGELGYRYYRGENGPSGFFVGASVLAGFYKYRYEPLDGAVRILENVSVGGAIDIGWQFVIGQVVVGPGIGIQYTVFTVDQAADAPKDDSDRFTGEGLRPRLLLSAGSVF